MASNVRSTVAPDDSVSIVHVNVGVAGDAPFLSVNRYEVRRVVDEEREGATVDVFRESAVVVTHHALFVFRLRVLLGEGGIDRDTSE